MTAETDDDGPPEGGSGLPAVARETSGALARHQTPLRAQLARYGELYEAFEESAFMGERWSEEPTDIEAREKHARAMEDLRKQVSATFAEVAHLTETLATLAKRYGDDSPTGIKQTYLDALRSEVELHAPRRLIRDDDHDQREKFIYEHEHKSRGKLSREFLDARQTWKEGRTLESEVAKQLAKPLADLASTGLRPELLVNELAVGAARKNNGDAEPLFRLLLQEVQRHLESSEQEPLRFRWSDYSLMAEHVDAQLGGGLVYYDNEEFGLGDATINRAILDHLIERTLSGFVILDRQGGRVGTDSRMVNEVVRAIKRKYLVIRPPRAEQHSSSRRAPRIVGDAKVLDLQIAVAPAARDEPPLWSEIEERVEFKPGSASTTKDELRAALGWAADHPDDVWRWRQFNDLAKARGAKITTRRLRPVQGGPQVRHLVGVRLRKT